MKNHLERWGLTAAAAAAFAGAACITIFLANDDRPGFLIWLAAALAVLSVAFLMAGVWAIGFARAEADPDNGTSVPAPVRGSAEVRRDNLERRLAVDEPRLCAESRDACTWWAFCGSAAEVCGPLTAELARVLGRVRVSDGQSPLAVHRDGQGDCRYGAAPRRR